MLITGVAGLIMTAPCTTDRINAEDASKFLVVITAILNAVTSILIILASLLSLLNMKKRKNIESYRRTVTVCIIASAVQLSLRCINGISAWQLCVLILLMIVIPFVYLFASRNIRYPVKRPVPRPKQYADY